MYLKSVRTAVFDPHLIMSVVLRTIFIFASDYTRMKVVSFLNTLNATLKFHQGQWRIQTHLTSMENGFEANKSPICTSDECVVAEASKKRGWRGEETEEESSWWRWKVSNRCPVLTSRLAFLNNAHLCRTLVNIASPRLCLTIHLTEAAGTSIWKRTSSLNYSKSRSGKVLRTVLYRSCS